MPIKGAKVAWKALSNSICKGPYFTRNNQKPLDQDFIKQKYSKPQWSDWKNVDVEKSFTGKRALQTHPYNLNKRMIDTIC